MPGVTESYDAHVSIAHEGVSVMATIPPPLVVRASRTFRQSAERLAAADPLAWAGIRAAMQYLLDFKRAAVAPDVRWHIVQSEFGRHCGEIRWPDPEFQSEHPDDAWRGLFVAHPNDDWYVFTVLGNKAGADRSGNNWYTSAVALSDEIAHSAIVDLGLSPFPIP